MPDWTVQPQGDQWTSESEGGKTTGVTVWLVRASEPTTPYAAERADESENAEPPSSPRKTPRIGQNYPDTTGVPCIKRLARAVDQTRMLYTVTCDYDSTSELTENPLTEPLKVSYVPESGTESYFLDNSDPPRRAVMTSEEPFAELPKRETGTLVLNISINVAASTNYSAYEAFCDEDGLLVNDEIVTIDGRSYAPGTLLAMPPQLSDVKEQNGTQYKTLSTTLRAKAGGWVQKYESRGLYEWPTDADKPVRIRDKEGEPIETAWPLDENGAALADPSDSGHEIPLTPYTEGDFTPLL